jgi:hypothetical protein
MVECIASVTINAAIKRVWRALSTRSEVPKWDSNLTRPIDVPDHYPHLEKGQVAKWKYWIGPFPCVLYDQPIEAIDCQTYAAENKVAFIRFKERYSIKAISNTQTQVDFNVNIWTTLPLMGPTLDKFILKPITDKTISSSLRKLKDWCENND